MIKGGLDIAYKGGCEDDIKIGDRQAFGSERGGDFFFDFG